MMTIKSSEILADVRSAAWLESELHPELDRHRRHEMADICEEGNVENVWRVLGISVAEVRLELSRILLNEKRVAPCNELERPAKWYFRFIFRLPSATLSFIKEKTHEYLVARVMAERTAVIMPDASGVWKERAKRALSSLSGVSSTIRLPYGPVRRPLWPL